MSASIKVIKIWDKSALIEWTVRNPRAPQESSARISCGHPINQTGLMESFEEKVNWQMSRNLHKICRTNWPVTRYWWYWQLIKILCIPVSPAILQLLIMQLCSLAVIFSLHSNITRLCLGLIVKWLIVGQMSKILSKWQDIKMTVFWQYKIILLQDVVWKKNRGKKYIMTLLSLQLKIALKYPPET